MKIKKITPLNTQILTTAEKYKGTEKLKQDGLILDIQKLAGTIKLHQKVIAVGPMVRNIKPGQTVQINPSNYMVLEHPEDVDSVREVVKVRNTRTRFRLPTLNLADGEVLILQERDIDFIIDEYEEDEE